LIKIDVENAEKEVLEGMDKTLRFFKPRLVVEIRKQNKEWVDSFLQDIGYIIKGKEGMNQLFMWNGQH